MGNLQEVVKTEDSKAGKSAWEKCQEKMRQLGLNWDFAGKQIDLFWIIMKFYLVICGITFFIFL